MIARETYYTKKSFEKRKAELREQGCRIRTKKHTDSHFEIQILAGTVAPTPPVQLPTLDPKGVLSGLVHTRKIAKNVVTTDFTVIDEGSIFLLIANTPRAIQWEEQYLPEDRMTFGAGVVVEHRYIMDIVNAIRGDGLTVAS